MNKGVWLLIINIGFPGFLMTEELEEVWILDSIECHWRAYPRMCALLQSGLSCLTVAVLLYYMTHVIRYLLSYHGKAG